MYLFQWFARAIRDVKFYEDELAVLMGLLRKGSNSRINTIELSEYDNTSLVFDVTASLGTCSSRIGVIVKPCLDTLIHVSISTPPDYGSISTTLRRRVESSFYQTLTTVYDRKSFSCVEFKL